MMHEEDWRTVLLKLHAILLRKEFGSMLLFYRLYLVELVKNFDLKK